MLPLYAKPHATAQDRIAHLRRQGLLVGKPVVAARKIEEIGYERLRIYFLSRRDAPNRRFRPGTDYNDILKIYECDAKLRALCLADLAKLEVRFRNRMSEALSSRFGSHPYEHQAAFKNAAARMDVQKSALSIFDRSKDQRAKHYSDTYGLPILPPIWVLKEFMSIGQAERIYANLAGSVRTDIAQQFGVPSRDVFMNWLKCFVDLRNACAHHDRIFNRRFQKQVSTLTVSQVPAAQRATLKALLECLDHVLGSVGRKSIVVEAAKVLSRYPEILPAEVGY